MNKAKIALSAIAIFAVIGGAFAIKTARTPVAFYKPPVGAVLPCTIRTVIQATFTDEANGAFTLLSIAPTPGSCPTYTTFSVQ